MVFVKEIMTKEVVSLPKSAPLAKLIHLMAQRNISCVAITDKGKLSGIITEKDLITKILLPKKDQKVPIASIMSKDLITVEPDASLIEAGHVMKKHTIRHLPVVQDQKLLGIVTQTDLAREAGAIDLKNRHFSTYQNVQSFVIILFFLFLASYLFYLFAVK